MATVVMESMEKFSFWGNVMWSASMHAASTQGCSDSIDEESSELKNMVEEEQTQHQLLQQTRVGLFERRHHRYLSEDSQRTGKHSR